MRVLGLMMFVAVGVFGVAHADDIQVEQVLGDQGRLDVPFGVDFDAAGNMYVIEYDGHRLFKRTPGGELSVIAGAAGKNSYTGDGGPAKDATFKGPHNIAVTPDGDIYVGDTWNCVVRKIDGKTGVITTIAGAGKKGYGGDGGPATEATFNGVFCITLNFTYDKLYIADLSNKRIRVVDLKTGIVDTVAGNGSKGVPKDGAVAKDSPLADPRAVAVDRKNNVYVLERGGHALRVVTPDGRIRTVAGGSKGDSDGVGADAQLNGPKHLCIALDDSVVIADAENSIIRHFNPDTGMLRTLPIKGLKRSHGVCVRKDGTLFIADSYRDRVLKVTNWK